MRRIEDQIAKALSAAVILAVAAGCDPAKVVTHEPATPQGVLCGGSARP